MEGRAVRIISETGPPRSNSVLQVAYRKTSFSAVVKLLKETILYITVYNNNNNSNNNKCEAVPLQVWSGPEGSRKLR